MTCLLQYVSVRTRMLLVRCDSYDVSYVVVCLYAARMLAVCNRVMF